MRPFLRVPAESFRLVLDRRRFIRWIYLARLSVAGAIYIGALYSWRVMPAADTQIASLTFAIAMLFTAVSAWRTESRAAAPSDTFGFGQHLFDAVVVTCIVHVTGGDASQFAALYILVNTSAALMLPVRMSLLIALVGSVLYAADVLLLSGVTMSTSLGQQLAVFFLVAIGTAIIGARLKAMSAASEDLAAQLTRVRLEAADILRNIKAAIFTVDAGGTLVYANPATADLLGAELAASLGRPVEPLLRAVGESLATLVGRAVREGIHAQQVEAQLTVASRSFPAGVTTTSDRADAVTGSRAVTVILQDISDQKRLAEFRRRAERLEAVAALSASLAHEIKNPLASIRSAVEQLGRSPRVTPDESTLARLIVRESDRLAQLLSEFLDFARTRVTRIERFDLVAVARGAARLAESHPAGPAGARVVVDTSVDVVMIDGDEDLLHRAIFNLTLNAVQASPPDGVVRIVLGDAHVGLLPPDITEARDAVQVTVADRGVGIAPEIRARLFEPFTTTRPGGSGLGLSIVHRAIEAHRGLILVDSAPTGSTFRIVLPRRQRAEILTEGALL